MSLCQAVCSKPLALDVAAISQSAPQKGTHRSKTLGQCNLQNGSSMQKWPPGLYQLLPAALPFFFCWGTNTWLCVPIV